MNTDTFEKCGFFTIYSSDRSLIGGMRRIIRKVKQAKKNLRRLTARPRGRRDRRRAMWYRKLDQVEEAAMRLQRVDSLVWVRLLSGVDGVNGGGR